MNIITDIYNKRKTSDRDIRVLDAIDIWMNKNIHILSDGLINNYPVFSASYRDSLAECYNLTDDDWKIVKKEMKMEYQSSILNIGLLQSYKDTNNKFFLIFLFILIHSQMMAKYWRNGFNSKIMKYTVDTSDPRTDFRQLRSLVLVVDKKVDMFQKKYSKDLKKGDDHSIRALLQAAITRMNNMIYPISRDYYKNFKDENIKIMIDFAGDTKADMNLSGFIEGIREKSIEILSSVSNNVLASASITNKNKLLFINFYGLIYPTLLQLTNYYINEWMYRNKNSIKLDNFKKTFMDMKVARNLKEKNEILDKFINDNKTTIIDTAKLNVVEVNNFKTCIIDYVIVNIYLVGLHLKK